MFKETSEKQELTKQWSTNKVLDFPTAFFFLIIIIITMLLSMICHVQVGKTRLDQRAIYL